MTTVSRALAPVRESWAYIDSTNPTTWGVPAIERVAPNDHSPLEVTNLPEKNGAITSRPIGRQPNVARSPDQPLTMRSLQGSLPGPGPNGSYEGVKPRPGCTPVTDLLIPETSTLTYTDEFFKQPAANWFLQNIQPNIYSYDVDTTPINALASGISYTPQRPPKFRDQVYNSQDGMTYPIYTRIDPQLIRDEGMPARLLEQPVRDNWSAKYSSWEAAPGSYDYEAIYDPRYNGYGDPYRAYSDVNLGNVN